MLNCKLDRGPAFRGGAATQRAGFGVLLSLLLPVTWLLTGCGDAGNEPKSQPEATSPGPAAGSAPPPTAEAPKSDPVDEEKSAKPELPRAEAPRAEPPTAEQPESEPPTGSPAGGEATSRGLGGIAGQPAPPPPPAPAPVASAPAADDKSDWDVIPVFYGTDREVRPDPKRLAYSSERGRRLELGRALVTVPKAHQVPAIERPWSVRIPYFDVKVYEETEDPKKHFTMQEIKALSRDQFLAFIRNRIGASKNFKDHAFVFVHGYNTEFDYAVYRTAQITNDLKFDGVPFLYSWPSGGKVASYTYDRESSGQAKPFMREFLNLVLKESGAKNVSVIAHSMGNEPLLNILRDLKQTSPPGIVLSQVILAAPDVDRDDFDNLAREISGLAKGITLYAASNDKALGYSGRFWGVPRAGDVPNGEPLVVPGVDTIDVSAVSTDSLGLNHSSYAENNALLNDIALLIQTGERPPDKRIPILERKTTAKGSAYWRYPAAR